MSAACAGTAGKKATIDWRSDARGLDPKALRLGLVAGDAFWFLGGLRVGA